MSLPLILLVLRLVAALLLLAFLGLIAWLVYNEMRASTAVLVDRQREYGRLRVLENGATPARSGETYSLTPVSSIGRAPGNTIVLDDDYASSEHALLMLRGDQWWLEDLNSRNGTFLNGQLLDDSTIVSPGDVITVGNTRLKVEAPPE